MNAKPDPQPGAVVDLHLCDPDPEMGSNNADPTLV